MLGILKLDLTEAQVLELIQEVDSDKDGEMNFKEYLDAVENGVFKSKDAKELFDVSSLSEVGAVQVECSCMTHSSKGARFQPLIHPMEVNIWFQMQLVPLQRGEHVPPIKRRRSGRYNLSKAGDPSAWKVSRLER
jgi:hypothetical protein